MAPLEEYRFQVELTGSFQDYTEDEDRILKSAFMTGQPSAKRTLRKVEYEFDFRKMEQINLSTGKVRRIRPPYKWRPPPKGCKTGAVFGPTIVVTVPAGAPGSIIQVPHPNVTGKFISVSVPITAKSGQAMLIPVPDSSEQVDLRMVASAPQAVAPPCPTEAAGGERSAHIDRWSTGKKVRTAGVTVAGVGAVIGGVTLGAYAMEHGLEPTVSMLAGSAEGAVAATGDFGGDAGVCAASAANSVGDFILDLF